MFLPKAGCYFITREGEVVGGPGLTHATVLPDTDTTGTVADALAAGHTRINVLVPLWTASAQMERAPGRRAVLQVAIEAPSMDALEWAVYLVQRDLPQATISYDITQDRKAIKSDTIYPGGKL